MSLPPLPERYPNALWRPSPNFDRRPDFSEVELVVIHAISLPPGVYGGGHISEFFQNRLDPHRHPYFAEIHELKVSAHLLIERSGQIVQFVAFDQRAWHAGVSEWRGRTRCNDFSIGIELEGCDWDIFSERQYIGLASVIQWLQSYRPILQEAGHLVGHSDIAPTRKTDPGPGFDWVRLQQILTTEQVAADAD